LRRAVHSFLPLVRSTATVRLNRSMWLRAWRPARRWGRRRGGRA
jgi:hypothetical protein